MAAVSIRKNADGTITVRVGKAIEHIDTKHKERGEAFDALKYALMSKGIRLEDMSVIEILWHQL